MKKSYESMIHLAAQRLQKFNWCQEIAKEQPDNNSAREYADRYAIAANAYCDAIADMFGRSYDAVYEDAHNEAAKL